MRSLPRAAQALADKLIERCSAEPARGVSFQGAPGANSHQAIVEAFPDAIPLPCLSFEDALDAVREGRVSRAMIPIENSSHGRVSDLHILLPECELSIAGEFFLRVRHCLVGTGTLGDVAEATSHPQALGQCRRWLRARGITPVLNADTAGAAAEVAEIGDPKVAAISSKLAAELYGLNILAMGIEDDPSNTTRFVILTTDPPSNVFLPNSVVSLFFETKNVPAALYKALGSFATRGVNLTKLESYQRESGSSTSRFYAEVAHKTDEENVAAAIDELRFHCSMVKVLGCYEQAWRP